ncbi:MAG: AsmA-like C-terminal region-containing protein, partial [Pseudomonadales bacterium]|nr:AsmA-like C-terminal region-containing protein [Pseudomonadales bacterium]
RITADRGYLFGYQPEDLSAVGELIDGRIDVSRISGELARGAAEVRGSVNLISRPIGYEGSAELSNADLTALLEPFARESWGDSAGLAELEFTFSGEGMTKAETLAALVIDGTVTVDHGHVYGSTLFAEISDATGIDEFHALDITRCGGQLSIADQRVSSPRLVLGGNDARLIATGSVGFDASLDLEVWVGFGPETERRIFSRGILLPYVTDRHGWTNIPTIVTGTIGEPKVRVAYDAYPGTAVRAVPDAAGRIVDETAGNAIRGSVRSFKRLIRGLGSVFTGGSSSDGDGAEQEMESLPPLQTDPMELSETE